MSPVYGRKAKKLHALVPWVSAKQVGVRYWMRGISAVDNTIASRH